MGRLSDGLPLSWDDLTQEIREKFRSNALQKFVEHFTQLETDWKPATWGDETEYTLLIFGQNSVKLHRKAENYLSDLSCNWHLELCTYQLESTPSKPYSNFISDLERVETSLKKRRAELNKLQSNDECVLTMCAWPRFHCSDFTEPTLYDPEHSIPLEMVSDAHRLHYLMKNLYNRRIGPHILVPVQQDVRTTTRYINIKPYEVCNAFCALQITIQASCFQEALITRDQMAVMCPFLIALSANAPAFNGLLLDTDCRAALQFGLRQNSVFESTGLPSRWSSIKFYVSDRGAKFNDVEQVLHGPSYASLLDHGIPEGLAKFTAYKLQYTPAIIYQENNSVDAAEVVNGSTVWHTVKLKVPENGLGWMVEVRPMDVQITDQENAALLIFVYMLSRTILHFDLDLLIPISELNTNIDKSIRRDAIRGERFLFRCHSSELKLDPCLMTVDEILNGNDRFPGFIPLIMRYVKEHAVLESSREILSGASIGDCDGILDKDPILIAEKHLNLVANRACGALPTNARKIRDFIRDHDDYKRDSVVSETILYDLVRKCHQWD